jgi:alginate O-acetyltransferase complex protein AlgI
MTPPRRCAPVLFNSLHFLVFFPVVTALYFAAPYRARWPLLLLASCYFYMALVPAYILILFALVALDYSVGIGLEVIRPSLRKPLLVVSLVANVGLLGFFKFFDFVNGNLAAATGALGGSWPVGPLDVILPIGLSFHTFQSMAYTIEVYRGNFKAERHLGIYAAYVLFYPQMVAGPIERLQNLLPQLRRH